MEILQSAKVQEAVCVEHNDHIKQPFDFHPGDNKVWRTVKHELSFVRIPGPTLQFTPSTRWFVAY